LKRDVRKPPKFDVFLNPAKKEDQESIERAMTLKFRLVIRKVLLYITVDSVTTKLHNGACTYRSIFKQMHYKTTFSHNGFMKSLEFYEN
jgi:hypothetical protein